jgi:hypothetical protein
MTRRILAATVAAIAAMTGMAAITSGCAMRTEASRPAAAAPDTSSGAAASASGASASASDSASALSDDDQVREVLFRLLFKENASAMKDRAPIYFLAVADGLGKQRDPSSALMARFAGHRPRVERVSRAKVSSEEGARHRETGDPGLIFHVGLITRVSDDVVEAECGYYEGNLSASGGIYRVERKAGVWVVTGAKMQWIA